jgi:DNA-binding LacI/PurR family transcriptional regulator
MSGSPKNSVTSISDIARLAGVSASTVSRALAGSKMISVKTRVRINELAREHGFQLNQMARNLRLKRSNAIGVIFLLDMEVGKLFADGFFGSMLGHVADAIMARGYDLLLSKAVPADEDWLDAFVSSGRVDGVIVIGQANQQPALRRVAASYQPIVVWGQYDEQEGYCSVGTDNVAGGRAATRHLLERGRRRIVFAGNADLPEFRARYEGFLAAHREAGIEPVGAVAPVLTADQAYAAMAAWLERHDAPDGIVAASDVVAVAAIRALRERGLMVPDDVLVTGYDDSPIAAQATPPLTTVRQDVAQGSAQLVDRLLRRIGGDLCERMILTPELIIRASAP